MGAILNAYHVHQKPGMTTRALTFFFQSAVRLNQFCGFRIIIPARQEGHSPLTPEKNIHSAEKRQFSCSVNLADAN